MTSLTTTKANFVSDPKMGIQSDLGRKIEAHTEGALHYFRSIFQKMADANPQNAKMLCEFISVEFNERNIKFSSRLTQIKIICLFNKYLDYKPFEHIAKNDIIDYLGTLKKTEFQDPTHKWIGTYNTRQMIISKFFRWLYNYHNEPDCNKWITPPCIQGIKQLPRKEKSPYKPSDIWTNEEHSMFLKYCPEKRDR